MNVKLFATVFSTIFLAELGDKTQLATFLYASEHDRSRLTIFLAAALALTLSSALGVLAGSVVTQRLNPRYVSWIAGSAFILIGLWTLYKA